MCRDSGVLSMWPGSDLVLAMWPSFGPVNWILASSVLVLSMLPRSGLVFAVWTDLWRAGCLLSAIGESGGLAL